MTTRREFLKKMGVMTATGLVIPSILTDNSLFARTVAANDQVNIALIGCRSMGWSDLNDFLIHPEINCIALCDIDKGILENRASELEKMRLLLVHLTIGTVYN